MSPCSKCHDGGVSNHQPASLMGACGADGMGLIAEETGNGLSLAFSKMWVLKIFWYWNYIDPRIDCAQKWGL